MPRRTRMYIPEIPVHIVQRGHNRQPCFFADDDYQFYRGSLLEALGRYGASCHAYCLMTNHIHLLVTPREEDSVQRVMQHLGRQYVQYVNKAYRRSGSLWEGRHKGCMVASGDYLLRCYRYIELNPVAAKMVAKPEEYRWSSFHYNAAGRPDDLITPHATYLELSKRHLERQFAYRDLFREALSDHDVHELRDSLNSNHVLGNERFKAHIEHALGRPLGNGKRGRPSSKTG